MHLEEALHRIQEIVAEIENKQLPLHEVMKLHEEGQKLVALSEKLLGEAQARIKLTEVEVDSPPISTESARPLSSDAGEINLF